MMIIIPTARPVRVVEWQRLTICLRISLSTLACGRVGGCIAVRNTMARRLTSG
jgi:hypothetical protein